MHDPIGAASGAPGALRQPGAVCPATVAVVAKAGASGAGAGKPRAPRSGAARARSPRPKPAAPKIEVPAAEVPAAEVPETEVSETEVPAAEVPEVEVPEATAADRVPAETAGPATAPAEAAPTTIPPKAAPRARPKRSPAKAAPRKAATGKVATAKTTQTGAASTEPPSTDAAPDDRPSAPSTPAKVAAAKATSPGSSARATSSAPAKAAPAKTAPTKTAPTKAAPATSARGLPDEIGGYRILGALGRGGMGAVYRARDGDGRIVALKLLHAHLDDPDARERLTREVASLQKVRHAGVARVLDAEIESTEAFVVTELVAGRDLGKHVKRNGPLPADQLVVLATRLREALDVVHGAGVLHRDLTPGNVMVTAEGPVLIDFGLAQAVEDARVTSTGLVTGTPGYVSPDLLDGDAPTEDSDWWGWAAVLTFAATGRPPFGRGAIGTVLTRVRAGEPDLTGLPEVVAQALRSALAVTPADRATPDEVIEALEAAEAAAADAGEADDADEAGEADEAATVALAPGTDADEAPGETVVVTAVAPTGSLPADEWVHDGGTTVMPAGRAEAWAVEDDQAYDEAYAGEDDADEGYDDGEAYDEAYEDDDEAYDDEPDEGYEPAYYPQPLARRTGTVAALALPFLALGLARPGAAFVAALVVAALLRSVELDAEALERRRARRGARPSDRLRALLTWPWYLVRGTLGVVPVLVVGGAVVVLVGGVLWWLIEAGHWTVAPLVPGQGSGLLRGNLPWVGRAWVGVVAAVGLAMVWFGPMARTHRDGARRVLAKAAPGLPGVLAAVVVGLVVAALLADAMLGQDVVWWPLGGPPDIG